jgi:trehalose synthase
VLQRVDVGERSLDPYRGIAPEATLVEVKRLAAMLRGTRVLHINATPYGGGVSELLRSIVPLLNDLGLIAEWKIISRDDAFFQVTKAIHNGLQGAPRGLTSAERAAYMANAERNAVAFEEEYDVVVVHDPQPAALPFVRGKGSARWIWRCHIDTSHPNAEIWEFLKPHVAVYDGAIFTMEEFVPPAFPVSRVEIIPPAIDPLSPKNFALPDLLARQVLDWIGVQLDRPLISQVSRFDPWKDPLGVVEAYRAVRREVPRLQLALVGSMALDDPEGWGIYRQILEAAQGDPLIHVFTNLTGVGNIEVNAFQRCSNVVVQKSIREGFGLVVSEALWKGTPVVAGRVGGIPLQLGDGTGGYLVANVDQCAEAILRLLRDPQRAGALGHAGRERVRQHFLLPRLLLNELSAINALVTGRPLMRDMAGTARRDPVCGMALSDAATATAATVDGHSFAFCSETCRTRFLEDPQHYIGAR